LYCASCCMAHRTSLLLSRQPIVVASTSHTGLFTHCYQDSWQCLCRWWCFSPSYGRCPAASSVHHTKWTSQVWKWSCRDITWITVSDRLGMNTDTQGLQICRYWYPLSILDVLCNRVLSHWLTSPSNCCSCLCIHSVSVCVDPRPGPPCQAWRQCSASSVCTSTWGCVRRDNWSWVYDKGPRIMYQEHQWVSAVSHIIDCFVICLYSQIMTIIVVQ